MESNREFESLKVRVGIIEKKMIEDNKPWYQQASNMISILAAIIAGVIAVWAMILPHADQKREEVREQQSDLRSIISDMVDNDQKFLTDSALIKDQMIKFNYGMFASNKQAVLLEAADVLVNKIPDQVTCSEYGILGVEKAQLHDPQGAENYYLKALNIADGFPQKMGILQSLGNLYFAKGPFQNIKKGENCFMNALSNFPKDDQGDGDLIYYHGFIYQMWASAELMAGLIEDSTANKDKAMSYFNKIRNQPRAINSIEAMEKEFNGYK